MSPTKRLSVRAVALKYGLPAGVVARAVASGDLLAVVILTDTGRERSYISPEDAEQWFRGRLSVSAANSSGGTA